MHALPAARDPYVGITDSLNAYILDPSRPCSTVTEVAQQNVAEVFGGVLLNEVSGASNAVESCSR